MGGVLIAYSGGVDSTYLAYVSNSVLGKKSLAVFAHSPVCPPADLEEAAEMDGATASQILRRIKLPLLLQILAPLLISSFAFNFNNFSLIYLLTGGGPTDVLNNQTAGATDILITYTYKTAFNGASQNYGLASAISMLIFLVVASLSLWSLRRSRVLDLVG